MSKEKPLKVRLNLKRKGLKQTMNSMPNEKESQNPWAMREQLPPVARKHTAMAIAVCFLCALGIPFCAYEAVSLILLAVLFGYVVFACRVPFAVALTLTTAAVFAVFGLGFSTGAVFLAVTVGICVTAFLLTTLTRGYLCAVLPIAAAVIAYLITRDAGVALSTLSFLPAAVLLSVATLLGKTRTQAICFALCGLLITVLAVLAVLVYRSMGALNGEAIRGFTENLREAVVQVMFTLRNPILENASSMTDAQSKAMYEQLLTVLGDDAIRNLVGMMFNILPALITVLCAVVAFEAQMLQNAVYRTVGLQAVLTREARVFTMSTTAAVIYALTFVLMLVIPSSSMASAVVQNICLMLLPGLCVIGITDIFAMISRLQGGSRTFFIVITVAMLCCCAGSSMLYILGMWGAYGVINAAIRQKMIDQLKQNGNFGDRDE